jgi:hypothetical protein
VPCGFFDAHIDLFQEKKISDLTYIVNPLFFLGPKTAFSQEMAKNKEKRVL